MSIIHIQRCQLIHRTQQQDIQSIKTILRDLQHLLLPQKKVNHLSMVHILKNEFISKDLLLDISIALHYLHKLMFFLQNKYTAELRVTHAVMELGIEKSLLMI